MNILALFEGVAWTPEPYGSSSDWYVDVALPGESVYNNRAIILIATGALDLPCQALFDWELDGTGSPWGLEELLSTQRLTGSNSCIYCAVWWKKRTTTSNERFTVNLNYSGKTLEPRDHKVWALLVDEVDDVTLAHDAQSPAINTITFPPADILRAGDLSLLVAMIEGDTTDITTPTDYDITKIEAGTIKDWTLAIYERNVSNQSDLEVTTAITGSVWHALHITPKGVPFLSMFSGDF